MGFKKVSKLTKIAISTLMLTTLSLNVSAQENKENKTPKVDVVKENAKTTYSEQFFPALVYRTGAYAPNGIPFANGFVDYLKLTNARGGINGVKVKWEECEFGYATDRGIECYEKLKNKYGGASVFQPLSTGVTFSLTEKVAKDKIPLITSGYGRSETQDGMLFKWNFPLLGTYYVAADILLQDIAKREGGFDRLKDKKIALVYHNSPFGQDPIPLLKEMETKYNFKLSLYPITHPGVNQKETWVKIKENQPDYILNWGWGIMNSIILKEAIEMKYPLDKMYGVWWSGSEPDVEEVEEKAKGYRAIALQHSSEKNADFIKEMLEKVHKKGKGTGPKDEVGEVLYVRGAISAMLGIEGVRKAQEKFGQGKVMTGEQVRWGLENLDLTQEKLDKLGFNNVLRPIKTSCENHMGSSWGRIHQWDGKKFVFSSEWYQADANRISSIVKTVGEKYATDNKLTKREQADCK